MPELCRFYNIVIKRSILTKANTTSRISMPISRNMRLPLG